MAENVNAPEIPRAGTPPPNTETNARRNRRNYRNAGTNNRAIKDFAGETKDVEAVLTLVTEQVDKRVTFEQFQETLKNYVLKTLENGEDVVPLIMKLQDPTTAFEKNHAPKDLTQEELASPVKIKMWELRIKQYLSREWKLRVNIHKLYAVVLGQCTQALRSTLKGDPEYEAKSEIFDVLWLLVKLKKLTAGVDAKANPILVLHEQIIGFFNVRQGQNESEDEYLVRFNAKQKSLEMMGGEHIFCHL
jgi:hypothetical protein